MSMQARRAVARLLAVACTAGCSAGYVRDPAALTWTEARRTAARLYREARVSYNGQVLAKGANGLRALEEGLELGVRSSLEAEPRVRFCSYRDMSTPLLVPAAQPRCVRLGSACPVEMCFQNAMGEAYPSTAADMAQALYRLQHGASDVRAARAEARAFEALADEYLRIDVKPELPEEARRLEVQAKTKLLRQRPEAAAELYARALEIAPWWPQGHRERAHILAELSRLEEAVVEMKRYLRLAPGAADAREARDRLFRWEAEAE